MNFAMLLRVIRSLDGILYATLATVFVLVYPSIGRNELLYVDVACVLPMAALAWVCFRLPSRCQGIARWEFTVFRLRCLTVAMIGFAPGAIFGLRAPDNMYLFLNSIFASLAGVGLLFNVVLLATCLAVSYRDFGSERLGRVTQFIIFYLLLVPLLGAVISLITFTFMTSYAEAIEGFRRLWLRKPWILLVVHAHVIIAIVFFGVVVLRVRGLLVRKFAAAVGDGKFPYTGSWNAEAAMNEDDK